VAEALLCLDSSVLVKSLVPEEPRAASEAADSLVQRGLRDARLVAPTWAWAEVGSVLLQKVRRRLVSPEAGDALWTRFLGLPIEFLDSIAMRQRAWEIARRYGLLTLYDACFLACTELALAEPDAERQFWTADRRFVLDLGSSRPSYVRLIGES